MRPLRVFLCHSSGDKEAVRALYRRLKGDGLSPWLDEEDLIPGQNWSEEIPRAVRLSHVVIVCLSRGSISKAGYVQKEIKFALDVSDEQPEDTIFLIPAKLEACDVPQRLTRWHWVNLYDPDGYDKLIRALVKRSRELELLVPEPKEQENRPLPSQPSHPLVTHEPSRLRFAAKIIAAACLILGLVGTLSLYFRSQRSLIQRHAVVHDGYVKQKESGFAFDKGAVVGWYSGEADILVYNPPKDTRQLAEFYIQSALVSREPTDKNAQGGMVRVPQDDLASVVEAPSGGYQVENFLPDVGNIYVVKTRDGKHYAKIKVTSVAVDRIEFDWIYQPLETRMLN